MASTRAGRTPRRTDSLSRERIVEAAVEVLDTAGENGLTFRVLTERLATGPGAIYWHVANREELLAAAADAVVTDALARDRGASGSPQDEIRAVALGLLDAVEQHPWLAGRLSASLSRGAREAAATRIFESVGRPVRSLGVPRDAWFAVATALLHHILGAAGQNAVNVRAGGTVGRDEFLAGVAATWTALDPDEYPFTRAVADQMREHDDREQFLAGVELVLAGIAAVHLSADNDGVPRS